MHASVALNVLLFHCHRFLPCPGNTLASRWKLGLSKLLTRCTIITTASSKLGRLSCLNTERLHHSLCQLVRSFSDLGAAGSGSRHQKMMEDYTDLKSAFFSEPDERTDFPKQFAEHHVLVLTASAFQYHFVEADADISEALVDSINLLVFDECNAVLRRPDFVPVLAFLMDYVAEGRMQVGVCCTLLKGTKLLFLASKCSRFCLPSRIIWSLMAT